MAGRAADLPDERRLRLRIGVNLGDIIVEGSDIYGDGVNLAARLEGLAEPGGICISGKVYEEVRNKLPTAFEDLGEQEVKNIAKPLHVYRLILDRKHDTRSTIGPRQRDFRWQRAAGIGFFSLLAVVGLWAWIILEPGQPTSSEAGCTDHLGLPVPAEECPNN